MMYNEASQYLATQIARAMNVPAYYISADMNNSMTYQNIIDGRKEFVAYSLQPYICAIEDRLSMNDITNSQNVVRFASDETFLRADASARGRAWSICGVQHRTPRFRSGHGVIGNHGLICAMSCPDRCVRLIKSANENLWLCRLFR
jgi:hypothetical protein